MGSFLIRMVVLVGVLVQAATLFRPAVSWGQVPTSITSSGLGTMVIPPPGQVTDFTAEEMKRDVLYGPTGAGGGRIPFDCR